METLPQLDFLFVLFPDETPEHKAKREKAEEEASAYVGRMLEMDPNFYFTDGHINMGDNT